MLSENPNEARIEIKILDYILENEITSTSEVYEWAYKNNMAKHFFNISNEIIEEVNFQRMIKMKRKIEELEKRIEILEKKV